MSWESWSHLPGYAYTPGDTLGTAAQLVITEDAILLHLAHGRDESTVAEARTREGTVPDNLLFVNADHRIALSGCRWRRHSRNRGGTNHAAGEITASAAVRVGPRLDQFDPLNGMRSTLTGLAAWAGLSSVTVERHVLDGRLKGVTVAATTPASIIVGGPAGVALRPNFRLEQDSRNGRYYISDYVEVETYAEDALVWAAHVRAHRIIQDLLALAYWWPCRLSPSSALRDDDLTATMDEEVHGAEWREVVVPGAGRPDVPGAEDLPIDRRPLFSFADIGTVGLHRWIEEYDELGRAMWPLVTTRYASNPIVEVELLQVGTALEALGHQLALRAQRLAPGRKDPTFHLVNAVRLVGTEAACSLHAVYDPHASFDAWVTAFNAAYKGVKHADNPLPAPAVSAQMAESGALLGRLWLATHLGTKVSDVDQRARFFNW